MLLLLAKNYDAMNC